MYNIKTTELLLPKQFGLNAHKYLKYFIIFTVWPVFNIGVSITFYLFWLLIKEIKTNQNHTFLTTNVYSIRFYIFAFVSFLSLIFSPWDSLDITYIDGIKHQIQYFYWMLVAVFIMHISNYINKIELNKYIFFGLIILTINFFFFNYRLQSSFVEINIPRNGYVYTVLAFWPLASGYIFSQYGKSKGNLSLIIVLILMLLTDGRAGVVIIVIENIFIYFIFNKSNAKIIRSLLLVFVPLLIIAGSEVDTERNRESLGNVANIISPRIGEFIKGEGVGGDLTFDKSWLIRELMITKGFEIVEDYPFFGVGIGHYTHYNAELKELSNPEYMRLVGSSEFDEYFYNTRSAHNSYIHILSEMGIIGFLTLMIILVPIILFSIIKLYRLTISSDDMPLISVIGICIHFYSTTSITGTGTWFVIGLAYSRMYKSNRIRKTSLVNRNLNC